MFKIYFVMKAFVLHQEIVMKAGKLEKKNGCYGLHNFFPVASWHNWLTAIWLVCSNSPSFPVLSFFFDLIVGWNIVIRRYTL